MTGARNIFYLIHIEPFFQCKIQYSTQIQNTMSLRNNFVWHILFFIWGGFMVLWRHRLCLTQIKIGRFIHSNLNYNSCRNPPCFVEVSLKMQRNGTEPRESTRPGKWSAVEARILLAPVWETWRHTLSLSLSCSDYGLVADNCAVWDLSSIFPRQWWRRDRGSERLVLL